MGKVSKIRLFYTIVILFISYKTNDTGDNMWGLKSIDLKESFFIKDKAYVHEIYFIPQKTSKDYWIKLFFPLIEYENLTPKIESAEADIINMLKDFEYKIYDMTSNEIIKQHTIKDFRGNSFIGSKPLSLGIGVNAQFDKNNIYKIILNIPAYPKINKKYQSIIFVIGIRPDVFW
jgi:hypothetical protein